MKPVLNIVKNHWFLLSTLFLLISAPIIVNAVVTKANYQVEVMISVNVPKTSISIELEKQEIKDTMQHLVTVFNIIRSDYLLDAVIREKGYHIESGDGLRKYMIEKIEQGTHPIYAWIQQFISFFDKELTPSQKNIQELRKNIITEHIPFTPLGFIRVRGTDRENLPDIANHLIVLFQKWQAAKIKNDTHQINAFIDERIALVQNKLSEREKILNGFLEKFEVKKLRLLDNEAEQNQRDLGWVMEHHIAVEQDMKNLIENPKNKNLLGLAQGLEENPAIKKWLEELISLEIQRAHDLSYYISSGSMDRQAGPVIRSIPAIESIRESIRELCVNSANSQTITCNNLSLYFVTRARSKALAIYKEQIKESRWEIQSDPLPKDLLAKDRLERRVNLLEELLVMLRKEKELNSSVRAKESLQLTVISPASLMSTYKINNRPKIIIFGPMVAFCLAIAIVSFIEFIRSTN